MNSPQRNEEPSAALANNGAIMIPCPVCHQQVSSKAPSCPHCGQPLATPDRAEGRKSFGSWFSQDFCPIAVTLVLGMVPLQCVRLLDRGIGIPLGFVLALVGTIIGYKVAKAYELRKLAKNLEPGTRAKDLEPKTRAGWAFFFALSFSGVLHRAIFPQDPAGSTGYVVMLALEVVVATGLYHLFKRL